MTSLQWPGRKGATIIERGTCEWCGKQATNLHKCGTDPNGNPAYYCYDNGARDSCYWKRNDEMTLNATGEYSERQLAKQEEAKAEARAKDEAAARASAEALERKELRERERREWERNTCSCVHRCPVHDLGSDGRLWPHY